MFTFPISAKAVALLAGCLLTTGTLFAAPIDPAKPASFKTSMYVTKANKIRVAVEKVTAEPITITLRPLGNGQPYVFVQGMRKKQDKLALQLDVSELADGVYELEIQSPTSRLTKQLTLTTPTEQNEVVRTIAMLPLPTVDNMLTVK